MDVFSAEPEPHCGLRMYRVGCNSSVGWMRRYHLEDQGCSGGGGRLVDLPNPRAGISLSAVITNIEDWVEVFGMYAIKGWVEILIVDIGSETED